MSFLVVTLHSLCLKWSDAITRLVGESRRTRSQLLTGQSHLFLAISSLIDELMWSCK